MNPEGIRRILISRMKFIGDVVLTTPVVRALRQSFPGAYIAYLGEKEAVSLLENNPSIDEVIPYDFSAPAFLAQPRMMLILRSKKFDAVIDLFSNPRTALLAFASGAPIRIGKDVAGRGILYTHRIRDDGKPKTAVEFHYQYIRPLGARSAGSRTEIFLTDGEKALAREHLARLALEPGKPIVGLHPGATWPAKMWPWESFAELGMKLKGELGVEPVLTEGPGEAEVVGKISARSSGAVKALPLLRLRELAAVISCMEVYVANDSGPMHIAPAVGTRTVGIFGPGEENIWFPYVGGDYPRGEHLALRKDVPCHPCHLDFCNRPGSGFMECMKLLSVGEVFEAVRSRVLGKPPGG